VEGALPRSRNDSEAQHTVSSRSSCRPWQPLFASMRQALASFTHILRHMSTWLYSPVGRFRIAALAEALSWAGLLIGMFFKYVVVHNEIGVKIMGPLHGFLFVIYIACTIDAMRYLKQPTRITLLGLLAAVPPFTTVVFERWLNKRIARKTHAPTSHTSPAASPTN
jgi:integral membrane protein